MTNEEIIEGLQNGKYKFESLSLYTKNQSKKDDFILSDDIVTSLVRNKSAHIETAMCSDFGDPPEKFEKIKFYFLVKQEGENESSKV